MEEILKEILKELQYQTKLLEMVFHAKDAGQVNTQQIQKRIASIMANVTKMPGMNQPLAKQLLNDLIGIIPKQGG